MLHRDIDRQELGGQAAFALEPRRSFCIACPLCHENRNKQDTRSLSVYRDEDGMVRYVCHHPGCAWNAWQSFKDPSPETIKKLPAAAISMPVPDWVEVPKDYRGDVLYWYRDLEGRYLFANRRIDMENGKLYVPFIYTEQGFATGKGVKWPEAFKGLYGAETIRGKTKAVVVEGEKAAEAAKVIFPNHAVVSWKGGANNLNSADWTLLRDIDTVLLWPDNDEAGRKAMHSISGLLPCRRILIAEVAHLSKGADLADDLSMEDIETAIREAQECSIKIPGLFTLADIEEQMQTLGTPRVSGYEVFDEHTKLPSSGLVVIEGRTKHGKSALAVALTSSMLTKNLEQSVTFYSYEMTAAKVFIRYIKTLNPKLDISNYRNTPESTIIGDLVTSQRLKIIDQSAQLSIADIVVASSRPQMRGGIIVIDYLQIVPASVSFAQRTRQIMLKEMLDALRVSAHANNVLVFVLSQLTPDYHDPRNDSPREAKDIHYSADLVLRVWNKSVGEANAGYDNISGDYIVHTYLNREGESNVRFSGHLEAGSRLSILRRVRDK